MTLPGLVTVAGKRWPVEECHQQGKGQTGLDQHQVRTWHSFCRHTVLSMCAQALLAIAAARPAPSAVESAAPGGNRQPAAWRDTGKLPAAAGDRPPGDDPGLVKVSVPEARRLLRLATTPMSQAARDLGYAWSRWRRRHQARARWHHYHTPAQSRPRHLTIARRKGPSYNQPDRSVGRPRTRRTASYPAARGWVTRPASTGSPSPDRSARAAGRPATAMRIASAGPVTPGPLPHDQSMSSARSRRPAARWQEPRFALPRGVRTTSSASRTRSSGTTRGIPRARRMSWWWMTAARIAVTGPSILLILPGARGHRRRPRSPLPGARGSA